MSLVAELGRDAPTVHAFVLLCTQPYHCAHYVTATVIQDAATICSVSDIQNKLWPTSQAHVALLALPHAKQLDIMTLPTTFHGNKHREGKQKKASDSSYSHKNLPW
jgi:hypothetical protein